MRERTHNLTRTRAHSQGAEGEAEEEASLRARIPSRGDARVHNGETAALPSGVPSRFWACPGAAGLKVRGRTYLTDKVKVRAHLPARVSLCVSACVRKCVYVFQRVCCLHRALTYPLLGPTHTHTHTNTPTFLQVPAAPPLFDLMRVDIFDTGEDCAFHIARRLRTVDWGPPGTLNTVLVNMMIPGPVRPRAVCVCVCMPSRLCVCMPARACANAHID